MKRALYVITCTLLMLGVTSAIAQPPGKGMPFKKHKSLRTVEDFESVEKDEKVGFVCMQCHSMSEMTVENSDDAMMYCKEGEMVTCPVCEKTYKTVVHGPPGKGTKHQHVKYVNEAGEECAFMTKTKSDESEEEQGE